MTTTLAALRDEHRHLLPHIDDLRTTGDAVGRSAPAELGEDLERAVSFLEHHLLPHAGAEDEVLYPEVERLMGSPEATATMRRDHVEVARLTAELTDLTPRLSAGETQVADDIRRVLYGLHAIVRLHFAKEEEVYVPLLEEHLSEDEAAGLMARLDDAHRRLAQEKEA
jgi:hemerythrin-like domain-containing protein